MAALEASIRARAHPSAKQHLAALGDVRYGNVAQVDFHIHSTWTDGAASVRAMHEQAEAIGLSAILFSEHARKTSGDWFPRFADEIRALPAKTCVPLVGVETKIDDFDGNVDATDEILTLCDLVMASVHRFPGEQGIVRGMGQFTPAEAEDIEFRLAMAALDNPAVDILGHPFGMCYRRFGLRPSDDKMRRLIARAAETGVAFEVNAHYHPDPWQLIAWCQEAGAPFSLGSNAHDTAAVGRITRILEGKEEPWLPSGF